jgi:hypothetical protein
MDCAVEPLKAVAAKAPFGKGADAIVDESVSFLAAEMFGRVYCKESCARPVGNLECLMNASKLLVFMPTCTNFSCANKGVTFPRIVILVIQLPSLHTGGEFCFSHRGETKNRTDSVRVF